MSKYNNDDCLMTSISNGIEEYAINKAININIPVQFLIRRHICEFIGNKFLQNSLELEIKDFKIYESYSKLLERIVK